MQQTGHEQALWIAMRLFFAKKALGAEACRRAVARSIQKRVSP
jgi:hypothetical protein